MFLPSTGKTCSLQEGTARNAHTLDQLDDGKLLACGGSGADKMCHQFVPSLPYGTWTRYAGLREERTEHTSFVSGGKVLLLGGEGISGTTAEVVGSDQSFNLQQRTR